MKNYLLAGLIGISALAGCTEGTSTIKNCEELHYHDYNNDGLYDEVVGRNVTVTEKNGVTRTNSFETFKHRLTRKSTKEEISDKIGLRPGSNIFFHDGEGEGR
jgi:hypothetical protein